LIFHEAKINIDGWDKMRKTSVFTEVFLLVAPPVGLEPTTL